MSRKTLLASLIAASLSGQLWAQSVQGTVVDEQGQPVADAWVTVIGQNKKIKTDASGHFEFTDLQSKQAELHIEASSFAHRNFHLDLPEQGLQGMQFALSSTALEVIDVKASPFHASSTESALPVSVLAGERLVPAGEVVFVPMGTTDSFVSYFAPANKFGLVNTIAEKFYLFTTRDAKGERIDIDAEMNVINVLRRPALVVKGTTSN